VQARQTEEKKEHTDDRNAGNPLDRRSDEPCSAGTVCKRAEGNRWLSGNEELVDHKHGEQRDTNQKRRKDLHGRPGVTRSAPGETESGQSGSSNHNEVTAVYDRDVSTSLSRQRLRRHTASQREQAST
jgi:hypothetical protein